MYAGSGRKRELGMIPRLEAWATSEKFLYMLWWGRQDMGHYVLFLTWMFEMPVVRLNNNGDEAVGHSNLNILGEFSPGNMDNL